MKKFLQLSIILVLSFLVIQLLEANAKILWKINQVNFNNFFDVALSLVKAFGYSLATVVIVIYYRSYFIRTLFIAIDMLVVYTYYHFNNEGWWLLASYAYPIYTGLIFGFIGHMAFERWKVADDTKELQRELEKRKIQDEIMNLKRKGGKGQRWDQKPELVEKIAELETKLKILSGNGIDI